jgi:hypothetical protein
MTIADHIRLHSAVPSTEWSLEGYCTDITEFVDSLMFNEWAGGKQCSTLEHSVMPAINTGARHKGAGSETREDDRSQIKCCNVLRDLPKAGRRTAESKRHFTLADVHNHGAQSFWKADSRSVSRGIPRLQWDPKVLYRVRKRPPPATVLSRIHLANRPSASASPELSFPFRLSNQNLRTHARVKTGSCSVGNSIYVLHWQDHNFTDPGSFPFDVFSLSGQGS